VNVSLFQQIGRATPEACAVVAAFPAAEQLHTADANDDLVCGAYKHANIKNPLLYLCRSRSGVTRDPLNAILVCPCTCSGSYGGGTPFSPSIEFDELFLGFVTMSIERQCNCGWSAELQEFLAVSDQH
jgi:hypothetical protein